MICFFFDIIIASVVLDSGLDPDGEIQDDVSEHVSSVPVNLTSDSSEVKATILWYCYKINVLIVSGLSYIV